MRKHLPTFLVLFVLVLAQRAFTQNKLFLRIDGIQGESSQADHKAWIDVTSFQQGITNSASTVSGGGAGSGKASFQDLKITKFIDRSTPELLLLVANGRRIPAATLELASNGKTIFIITLKDLMVTSVASSLQGGISQEEVRITFNNITWEYRGNNISAKEGWDLLSNKNL